MRYFAARLASSQWFSRLRHFLGRQLYATFVTALLGVSVCHTIVAYRLTAASARRHDALRAAVVSDSVLDVGDRVPEVLGFSLGGVRIHKTAEELARAPVLVLTFSVNCPACNNGFDAMRRVVAGASARGVQSLWVSRDAATEIGAESKWGRIAETLVVEPSHTSYAYLQLARVPQVALLAGGRIRAAWHGVLSPADERAILAAAEISAPQRQPSPQHRTK